MTDFAPPPPAADASRVLRESLAREAAELELRLAELDGLVAERRAVERELEELHGARAGERRRALPVLGEVRSAGRCGVQWDALPGDGRVRRCDRCGASVADPRRLDGARVRALLGISKGPVFARPDGSVMATECPRAARRRSIAMALAAMCTVLMAIVLHRAIEVRATPSLSLQYLSSRSELGHRPSDIARWAPIAPRAR